MDDFLVSTDDFFNWNDREGYSRLAIEAFLREVQDKISRDPGRFPFRAVEGNLVINTLRAMLDSKPSQMRGISPEEVARSGERHG